MYLKSYILFILLVCVFTTTFSLQSPARAGERKVHQIVKGFDEITIDSEYANVTKSLLNRLLASSDNPPPPAIDDEETTQYLNFRKACLQRVMQTPLRNVEVELRGRELRRARRQMGVRHPSNKMHVAYYALHSPTPDDVISARFPPDNSCVIILTGWGESYLKNAPLINIFLSRNVTVATVEWYRQGVSPSAFEALSREHQTTPTPGGIHGETLKTVMEELRGEGIERVDIVAHSMGGMIALITRATEGIKVGRTVLLSPMISPNLPLPSSVARFVCSVNCKVRRRRDIGVTKPNKIRDHTLPPVGITGNLTNLACWEYVRKRAPEVVSGTVSWGWLGWAIKNGGVLGRLKGEDVRGRLGEVRVLQASQDSYVSSSRCLDWFARRGIGVEVWDGYHDLLDEGRGEVGEEIVRYLCDG